MDIRDLEPKSVFKHFLTICSIPHPSHEERALGEALMAWAEAKGIEAAMDPAGNIAMRKPASPGKEGAPGVILQAHLDMVPQKAGGSTHDFSRDPILPRLDPADPAWLVATGTTLGADDGMGIAMAMAALEDDSLVHGPLECLFTVNEEDGMSGARAIGEDFLSGSLLLNIDGEDDGELTIGCAGSIRALAELTHPTEAAPSGLTWLEASVGGLLGGHSGVDIDKGRANATLALVGLLERTREHLFIAGISGGTASNAIPREARAVVGVAADRAEAFKASFAAEATKERIALGDKDPGFVAGIAVSSARPERALPPGGAASMLSVLGALPNGLIAMEPDMPGLIRTSLNLGTLAGATSDGLFRLAALVMIRSSSGSEMEALGATVEKRLAGAADHGWSVSQKRPSESPAWSPDTGSPLLATTKAVYKRLSGKEPRVSSTHGGLETGLFRPRFPKWDMISLGPNIRAPHSPDERVEIASVQRSYRFVRELVQALAVPEAR
ncbi:MAG: cytosol nonspecific dipeptidase [Spirochaetae bacterium HGW-Spirochaetae-3]|jgi:dipeptidase D|nr:MAG: cytosol nonspecific dipeptidase [Spirochaetae bacterium HGW-Spirochaetae-3]